MSAYICHKVSMSAYAAKVGIGHQVCSLGRKVSLGHNINIDRNVRLLHHKLACYLHYAHSWLSCKIYIGHDTYDLLNNIVLSTCK